MTTTVTTITRLAIMSMSHRTLSGTVGLVAVVLLLVLLTERELLRAADVAPWRPAIQALRGAILPLGLMFCVIVAARLALDILHVRW